MSLQVYSPQFVLDIYTYDDSFYTVPFEQFDALQDALNTKKFIRIKDDLLATSSVKKVEKRALQVKVNESEKYDKMMNEPTKISKEMIEQAKQNAQKYKTT
jgi:hypothetical protein